MNAVSKITLFSGLVFYVRANSIKETLKQSWKYCNWTTDLYNVHFLPRRQEPRIILFSSLVLAACLEFVNKILKYMDWELKWYYVLFAFATNEATPIWWFNDYKWDEVS